MQEDTEQRNDALAENLRDCAYLFICLFVQLSASSMLKSSLDTGSGYLMSDSKTVVLSAFWGGGLAVFVIQILVLVEMAVRWVIKK